MENKHQQIDLTTLQEVERLLNSVDFASAEDLVKRGVGAMSTPSKSASAEDAPTEGFTPLPQRR